MGILRLSLRTALSAPERDHVEKLNPTYDPRSAALRRRYQLVALQSVLFLGAPTCEAELIVQYLRSAKRPPASSPPSPSSTARRSP